MNLSTENAFINAAKFAYSNGLCHVMALAIQACMGGKIIATVCFDDDAEDESVDHMWVLKDGVYYDINGEFTDDPVGMDGGIPFEVDQTWINEQVEFGMLRTYNDDDLTNARHCYEYLNPGYCHYSGLVV